MLWGPFPPKAARDSMVLQEALCLGMACEDSVLLGHTGIDLLRAFKTLNIERSEASLSPRADSSRAALPFLLLSWARELEQSSPNRRGERRTAGAVPEGLGWTGKAGH